MKNQINNSIDINDSNTLYYSFNDSSNIDNNSIYVDTNKNNNYELTSPSINRYGKNSIVELRGIYICIDAIDTKIIRDQIELVLRYKSIPCNIIINSQEDYFDSALIEETLNDHDVELILSLSQK